MRLETERLLIKPHSMSNLEKLHQWHNDPELGYYDDDQPEPHALETLADTRRHLRRIMIQRPQDTTRHFAIHKVTTGELIGYGMIAFIDRYHRRCRLGLTIGEKNEWGQGYARETCEAVIAYCFEEMDMNRIGAEIFDFNHRSINLFKSLGFRREGRLRQYVLKRGRYADELVYGLLREEWNAQKTMEEHA